MKTLIADYRENPGNSLQPLADALNECQEEFRFESGSLERRDHGRSDEAITRQQSLKYINQVRSKRIDCDFVVAVIDAPFDDNWFSFTDHRTRGCIITTHGWEMLSHLPLESYLGVEIIQNFQEYLVGWKDYLYAHEKPLGCLNDLCIYKPDISLKIRTGDICPQCLETWRAKLTAVQVMALQAMQETIRKIALRRLEIAEIPFEEKVVFPVAVIWRMLRQECNPTRKFSRLIDLFDVSVRFSVASLVASTLDVSEQDPTDVSLSNEFRRYVKERPSLGDWVNALPRALEYLDRKHSYTLFDTDCLNRARRACKIIEDNKLVRLRNETRGHAFTLPEAKYEELFQSNYASVYEIIRLLRGILSTQLISVSQIRFETANNTFVVKARSLIGSNPVFGVIEFQCPTPMEENEVALLPPSRDRQVGLGPLVLWGICPECRHERVLITDDDNFYLDPQIGHRVRFPI